MSATFPLATSTWDQAEHDAMQRVIASDRYTMGPEVAAFERRFAEYFGTKFAVMVNSGSSANLIMAAALTYTTNPDLKLNPGDEVIVPAVSWSTTYYPLHQYGLKMVFVDIDPDTLNYDLDALADAVTDRTRALMVVNLLGNPNDFDAIAKITAGRGIVIPAQNLGSTSPQRMRRGQPRAAQSQNRHFGPVISPYWYHRFPISLSALPARQGPRSTQ